MLLPSLSHRRLSASQHGDFGIAAELRCHGSGPCCRTAYTWDLESLSGSPCYLFHLSLRFSFGVAEAISTPLLSLFIPPSPQPITPQKYSHIRNETHTLENKNSCPYQRLCFSRRLPLSTSSFHFLCSCLDFVPRSIPMWGFRYGVAGYHGPPSPPGIHHCLCFTLKHNSASLPDRASNSHRLI